MVLFFVVRRTDKDEEKDEDHVEEEDEAEADAEAEADEDDDDGEEAEEVETPPPKKQRQRQEPKSRKTVGADGNMCMNCCSAPCLVTRAVCVSVATEYITGDKMDISVTFQWHNEATELSGKLVAYFKPTTKSANVNLFALNELINQEGGMLFGTRMVVVRYKAKANEVWKTGKHAIDYSRMHSRSIIRLWSQHDC